MASCRRNILLHVPEDLLALEKQRSRQVPFDSEVVCTTWEGGDVDSVQLCGKFEILNRQRERERGLLWRTPHIRLGAHHSIQKRMEYESLA